MANSKQTPHEFLSEFIELYRSFPCLWKIKSDDYSDRRKKDLAYADLVKKYREFDPSADRTTVVKKINGLRTVYNKERAKVISSLKSGAWSEEVYKPTLWYYDLMHFLYDQDSAGSARCTMDDEDKRIPYDDDFESKDVQQLDDRCETPLLSPVLSVSDYNEPAISLTTTPNTIVPRPKRKRQLTSTDEFIQLTGKHLKSFRPDDEFDAYGKYIAHKLRSLTGMQSTFAQKLINDVIFEGELEELSKDFKVIKNPPQT